MSQNLGLHFSPPWPEQRLFLLKRSGHLSSQDQEYQLFGPSWSLVVGIPSCLKSPGAIKFLSRNFFPSQQAAGSRGSNVLSAQSAPQEGGNVANPLEGSQKLTRPQMENVYLLHRLSTPSRPPPALPGLVPGQRFHWLVAETSGLQNWFWGWQDEET